MNISRKRFNEKIPEVLETNTTHGEWTECKDCNYFEDCEAKEGRDGCYFGESENEEGAYI